MPGSGGKVQGLRAGTALGLGEHGFGRVVDLVLEEPADDLEMAAVGGTHEGRDLLVHAHVVELIGLHVGVGAIGDEEFDLLPITGVGGLEQCEFVFSQGGLGSWLRHRTNL